VSAPNEDPLQQEQNAIQRLKRGDISGLEYLVTRYQVRAMRAAFLILQDEAQAEDVVQGVFLHLYHHIRRFDETRPFGPYLMRSVVNAALNQAQSNARLRPIDPDAPMDLEQWLADTPDPESLIEAAELRQQVLQALKRLAPRQRAAIVQRYYLQMSEQEMAQNMQAAPGTVKWLLNAARARLRALLERSER